MTLQKACDCTVPGSDFSRRVSTGPALPLERRSGFLLLHPSQHPGSRAGALVHGGIGLEVSCISSLAQSVFLDLTVAFL